MRAAAATLTVLHRASTYGRSSVAPGLQCEGMTLGGLERAERQHDDVRPVRLHLHVRLLGLVADRQAGGELGAEPRRRPRGRSRRRRQRRACAGDRRASGDACAAVFWLLPTAAPTQRRSARREQRTARACAGHARAGGVPRLLHFSDGHAAFLLPRQVARPGSLALASLPVARPKLNASGTGASRVGLSAALPPHPDPIDSLRPRERPAPDVETRPRARMR